MRRALALTIAVLGCILVASGAALFASGSADVFAAKAGDSFSGDGGNGAPAIAATPKPRSTPTPRDPAGGSTDVDPFDVPPSTSPEEAGNAQVWVEQQRLISECMAEKGYDYPVSPPIYLQSEHPTYLQGQTPMGGATWIHSLPQNEQDGAWLALFGDTGAGADYHWQEAGCDGYAVEATGMGGTH